MYFIELKLNQIKIERKNRGIVCYAYPRMHTR